MRFICAVLITIIAGQIAPAAEPPAKGDVAPHIERLIKQLGAASFAERERAQKGLIAIGGSALPGLQKAIADRDLEIARRAKQCIKEIKINSRVAAVVADLKSPDPKVRWAAANEIMLNLRARAKDAVPALIEALDEKDKSVRQHAASALQMVGPAAKAAVPRLTRLLNDRHEDRQMRWMAARTLSFIGTDD